MRFSTLLAIWLALSTGQAMAAGVYDIDPGHTQVQFEVGRFGFTRVLGVFPHLGGEFELDGKAPEKSTVRVVIQTADIDSNNPLRDKFLRSPDWFDVAKFPTMAFVSTKVTPTSPTSAKVAGRLTLHGVTRAVILDVHLNKIGPYVVTGGTAAGFSATTELRRSDFGMTTAPRLIGEAVNIRIEALGILRAR